MTERPDNLKELIGAVQLRGVRLLEVDAKRTSLSEPTHRKFSVELAHSARTVLGGLKNGFLVLAELKVAIGDDGESKASRRRRKPKPRVLEGRIALELVYELPKGSNFDIAILNEFAQVNGVYNAWPYWRELVQDLTTRMGLPPLTLPLFRVHGSDDRRVGRPGERRKIVRR